MRERKDENGSHKLVIRQFSATLGGKIERNGIYVAMRKERPKKITIFIRNPLIFHSNSFFYIAFPFLIPFHGKKCLEGKSSDYFKSY